MSCGNGLVNGGGPSSVNSFYDLQNLSPKSPLDLLAKAELNSTTGTPANSTTFFRRLEMFAAAAARAGYLRRAQKPCEYIYCQVSDCKLCQDKSELDPRWWGYKPLPMCSTVPPRKTGSDERDIYKDILERNIF